MNVIKVIPRGFCIGVVTSIKMAKDAIKNYPNKKIYMIGLLVHNKIIVNELKKEGIILIDDWKKSRLNIIRSLDKDSVVIFSAHGTAHEVIQEAKNRGLIVIDTKCEWVLKTENLIKQYLEKNFEIIFIGKHNHPETIALTSIDKNKIHLVTNIYEIEQLNIKNENIFVTNQTTLSIIDTQMLYKKIKEKFKNSIFKNDICQATLLRQEAVLNLDSNVVQLLYVVGDKRSNNTNKLVELGLSKNIKTIRIDDKNQIDLNDLKNISTVAVTAGASTPSVIQNDVIKFLEKL